MLEQYDITHFMVEGAYKKLKSYYYYDKKFLHIKKRIAIFENSNFEEALNELTANICSCGVEYFDSLIDKIDFIVLPKKFKSQSTISENVIKSDVDHTKDIDKINFFIDMPIELLIVDFLWMLLIGKISFDNYGSSNVSFAGKFKKGIFKSNSDDLFNGIDFASNRCFIPYFGLYSKWRDLAFNKVRKKISETDVAMMSLDLKSFYYSVEFDFNNLKDLLNNDHRMKDIQFLTDIIEKIFKEYTKLISPYKKGIKKSNKFLILPIGMQSSVVLRELYLREFDNIIRDKVEPFYYGRYVDDILIVVDGTGLNNFSSNEYIEKFLIHNDIVLPCGNCDYKFTYYPNIKIQKEKVNCFFFEKNTKDILVEIYYEQIKANSSEVNLLPDMELLNESFNKKAYTLSTSDGSNKLRNLDFMQSNNYNATLFVNGLKRIIKNTNINSDTASINPYLDEILTFYSGSQGVEYSNSWCSLFELFILCHDKDKANKFYNNIKSYIAKLSFNCLDEDEIYENKKKRVLKRLQTDLKAHLDIAISLSIALDYNAGKPKHREFAKQFRQSNLFNHHLVSFPLLNYSESDYIENVSLIDCDINNILSNCGKRNKFFKLDENKLKWSPRFIHLDELYFCIFFYFFGDNQSIYKSNSLEIFKRYAEVNNLPSSSTNPVIEDIEDKIIFFGEKTVRQRKFKVEDTQRKKVKIGLVNTNISEKDAFTCLQNPKEMLHMKDKQKLFKILTTAKEEKTNYLIFPEFYMPVVWLYEFSNFAKIYGITIITGLQYLTCNDRAFNMICTLQTAKTKHGFKNCFPLFREKNYYAPDEKIGISKMKFRCQDNCNPFYYIISNPNIDFTTILCFEFTDISSRASMKTRIDVLFVPQFNKDTRYFSSIVESTTRDLHCFIIQANTSRYGDSRITAPFKTDFKDILQIKGGINDTVVVGEIDVAEFRHFQKTYTNDLEKIISLCYKCNKVRGKSVSKITSICKKCTKKIKKDKIKGLPPNFIR